PAVWRQRQGSPAAARGADERWFSIGELRAVRSGLDELERHAVGLADRDVFRVVELGGTAVVARAPRGRQRPDAERMILGVAWIRVDLGAPGQLEASLLGVLDHE